jgi:hypothetical protein
MGSAQAVEALFSFFGLPIRNVYPQDILLAELFPILPVTTTVVHRSSPTLTR